MDIIQISWRDIPGRDQAWYDEQKARMTEDEIAQELDINYEKSVRSVVYKEFKEAHILRGPWSPLPHHRVIRVLDYGKTCAAIFAQKDVYGRVTFFHEIVLINEENPTHKLAQAVKAFSDDLDCQGFADHDDPAGSNDNYVNADEQSFKIVQQFGIYPTHEVSGADNARRRNRIETCRYWLSQYPEGKPVIRVHESCTYLIDALQGGYRHKEDSKTKEILDEIHEEHPHEDLADCFGIALVEQLSVEKPVKIRRNTARRGNRYTGY